ncbi:MAG: UvrD-helicase domain-containing protein [Parahaliea sp.]
MSIVVDAAEREAAIDPTASFCISAPAGSGKTELLIQRYLSLLSRVQYPEQILAITFTRKAAAEMRERVIGALQAARDELACDSHHQQRTRELANAALVMDARHNWQLLANSARFNIRTIDGFCAVLTRQMPVLSGFGAQLAVIDNAQPLYAEAVAELFAGLEQGSPIAADLRQLMLHFDNRWDSLSALLQTLLARRSQWLSYMGVQRTAQASEQQLRQTLEALIKRQLTRSLKLFKPWLEVLYALMGYASDNLGTTRPDKPGNAVADLSAWRALRHMLLVADGSKWRTRITKNEGFPAGKGAGKAEADNWKGQLKAVIAELSTHSDQDQLRLALTAIDLFPNPQNHQRSDNTATSDNWQLVLALAHVLPMLAAQLLLVFQHHGCVDHAQVAQSALDALGEDDTPSDLALRLDYRIEHILVDEFQDTAIDQYRLVERLTRGWGEHNVANPQAPRTLLIVGDGMQSIYGFRDANVGLFLRARQHGFNGVLPHYLVLRSNFRSDAGIVDWVNCTFGQVFPDEDDISRGRVKFSKACAVKAAGIEPAVNVRLYHSDNTDSAKNTENTVICDLIEALLKRYPQDRIAILGRSRPQLQTLLAQLRQRNIAFAANEMDRLQHSPVVLDLMTLARALANRADSVAWWALLRAPWCGLSLADLHQLNHLGEVGPYPDLLALISSHQYTAALSPQGQIRCAHLASVLNWAEAHRGRRSQRAWLEQIWLQLDGPATVGSESALADAEQFFRLLESAELEGRQLDIQWLQSKLDSLYADAGGGGARVEVMTLHKAKGLEFEHVFIPGLARTGRSDERALLLWDEYSDTAGAEGFLMAADDHSKKGEASLYNFLAEQRKQKQLLENTRLLYVGATRAIRSLYLSATLSSDEKSSDEKKGAIKAPSPQSLLACIWPVVQQQARQINVQNEVDTVPVQTAIIPLQRLRSIAPVPDVEMPSLTANTHLPPPADNRLERHSGTAIHLALEQLARRERLPMKMDSDLEHLCHWALQNSGLSGETLQVARRRVNFSINKTLADEEGGRWLLRCDHTDSSTELPLVRVDEKGIVRHIIIDRSFIDARSGKRWIIDYKSSQPLPGMDVTDFLNKETARYQKQLATYHDALKNLGDEPICCALYFTALAKLLPVSIN